LTIKNQLTTSYFLSILFMGLPLASSSINLSKYQMLPIVSTIIKTIPLLTS